MTPRAVLISLALLSTAGLPLLLPAARACAPVPPKGQHVEIAEESAIILWDAAGKTQHFIRRASFKTQARDFGFLVPTPSEPKLTEVGDQAFSSLETLTAPQVITRTLKRDRQARGVGAEAPLPGGVQVLQVTRVAGLKAAVLKADDPSTLNGWLGEHGYPSSPALERWLAPYVEKHWTISAFRVPREAESPGVGTSALRMTFETARPFFPYREPEDQREGSAARAPRLLRVYFLGESRVQGTLGEKGAWPGRVVWAGPVPADRRQGLLPLLKLPARQPPAAWWLTEFEDRSAPRPGTDEVYFSPSEDQSTVVRDPETRIVYVDEEGLPPLELHGTDWALLYALLGLFLVVIIAVAAWLLLTRKNRHPHVHR
jgi:hypothetical protein